MKSMPKSFPRRSDLPGFCRKKWYLLILAAIVLLSFGLNFWSISAIGYGNAYYAAAIRSMTESFHNFFFVSFDPAGVVSVDKPPLGLWVQAVFVLIFGYHGWAMLLPQALAGAASSLMMYILTAKRFGRPAGLISALVFALTPAAVVASRNNTMDMQLIFVLLAATWFLFRAIDSGRWRWLFIAAVFVGLGFNVKMLQAYLILPAVVIVYLIFAKEKFPKRLLAGGISLLIMLAVSFAWVFAVDLTPASGRPYVGSSTNNTETELIIGHNGLERIYGQGGGTGGGIFSRSGRFTARGNWNQGNNNNNNMNAAPGGQGGGQMPQGGPNGNGNANNNGQNGTNNGNNGAPPSFNGQQGGNAQGSPGNYANGGSNESSFSGRQFGRNGNRGGFGGMGGGMGGAGNDIGSAGPLRLWSSSLYGQASWLLILALFCIAVKLRRPQYKMRTSRGGMILYWGVALLTMYGFFSFAGFWHRYYLCMFAPAVAGLVGPGLVHMVRSFREKHGWKQFLLPASLLATFAMEIVYVWSYSQLRSTLVPIMAGAAGISLLLMAFHRLKPKRPILLLASGFMLLSLLAAPFYWALTVILYPPQNSTMPYAGPELASTSEIRGMTSNQEVLTTGDSSTQSLEKYLVAHYKKGSYLVVSQRADDVAQFIVDTGLPAVAYGGFLGSDNAITLDELKALVKEGKVTYFLATSDRGGSSNSELISYVKANATPVSSSEYLSGSASSGESSMRSFGTNNGVSGTLYLFKSGK